MNQDDYKAGLRGDAYSPTMDRQAYDEGASVRKTHEGILGAGIPQNNLTAGVGFVIIVTSPILIFLYPAGGLVEIAPLLLIKTLQRSLSIEPPFAVLLLLMIVVAVATYFFAVKVERFFSRFKIYRILRHLFRMAALGSIAFKYIIASGNPAAKQMSIAQTFDNASGGSIVGGLVVLVVMHFLFLRLDKGIFPVKDPKTGLLESELSDDERENRRAKVAGKIKFILAFVILTVILSGFMRGISVLAPAGASFVICWIFGMIFKKRKRA